MRYRTLLFGCVPLIACALVSVGCAKSIRTAGDQAAEAPVPPASDATATSVADGNASPITHAQARHASAPTEYMPSDALKEVHFDFDRADVRAQDLILLDRNAAWMLENKKVAILVTGHTDERGTDQYNVALGDRRAKSTVNYLVSKGVAASRFTVLSYGEERPVCKEHAEGCWAQNRRAAFLVRAE